jgi:hypothetical protein
MMCLLASAPVSAAKDARKAPSRAVPISSAINRLQAEAVFVERPDID